MVIRKVASKTYFTTRVKDYYIFLREICLMVENQYLFEFSEIDAELLLLLNT